MRLRRGICAFLLVFALLMTIVPASADVAAYVSKRSADVYADSALTQKIGTLSYKSVLTVRSQSDGVAKITFMGKNGYVSASALTSMGGESEEIDTNTKTRFFRKASLSGSYKTLSKGTTVTLLATNGKCAMVEINGYIGFVPRAHLGAAPTGGADDGSADTADDTADTPPSGIVTERFTATVTADSLAVYRGASTSSSKMVTLKKGETVTVVAYDDTWACLQNGRYYGYALRSGLTRGTVDTGDGGSADTGADTGADNPSSGDTAIVKDYASLSIVVSSGKYTNEEVTFLFLTRVMKLNTAAACGILANIKAESSFRPTAYNPSGGSYGICQWTGGRKTRLQTYCSNNGYDYTTLAAQLYFLKYELEKHYTKTLSNVRGTDNSAQGAYDAGYYWCYNFEVPANRASTSVKRGNTARDTYWPKYS